jgi:hypothetical protein
MKNDMRGLNDGVGCFKGSLAHLNGGDHTSGCCPDILITETKYQLAKQKS